MEAWHERAARQFVHSHSCFACPVACRHAAAVRDGPYPGRYDDAWIVVASTLGDLLGTEGGKVTLQLVGACGGCPLSTMTLTAGIERILRDRVPGVEEVVAI